MHDLDAMLAGFDRPMHGQLASFHMHSAVAGTKISGDDFDEGRLASAVVAHQSHDLAGLKRQRDIVEGMNRAEMLRNFLQFEKSHSSSHLSETDAVWCPSSVFEDQPRLTA